MQLYSKNNIFSFSEKYVQENKNIFLAALVLFILPLLPLNQFIVGTIVNAILIKSAISMNSKKVFLLSVLPSLAVFLGGVLFANVTLEIALMLPFIWAGNFVLMLLTRKLFVSDKKSYFVSTLISSIGKTLILFFAAFVLLYFGLVPAVFLTMFGVMQFVTAQSGAVLVYLVQKVNGKL